MQKWELNEFTVRLVPHEYEDRRKDSLGDAVVGHKIFGGWDEDANKDWAKVKEAAAEGWELVSVVPLNTLYLVGAWRSNPKSSGSYTARLLYTFKRPLAE